MQIELVSLGLACADVLVKPVDALPERGKLSLVPDLEIHLGGLAGVAAAVYSRLGGSAAFVGVLGRDGFGSYVETTLREDGVKTDFVRRAPDLGTPATVVLVSSDGERTFLHRPGCSSALTESDIDVELLRSSKHLHWGGPAVTPALDGEPIGRILKRAKDLGLTTSMDTCYDGLGKWMPRIEHALPYLDVVMSSIEEARCYTGKDDPEGIADAFRSYGAGTAMIKLGEDGLFVKNCDEALHVAAHRVDVVDTTGAGDASCGAFLFGYIREWSLSRCAQLANAVGALTVQVIGGSEGVVSLDAVTSFMEHTPVLTEAHS